MKSYMKALLAACGLATGACMPGGVLLHDEAIDGPYRLRAAASAAEMHVCYRRTLRICDRRIPGRVFAIAHDEDFIVAAVHPLGIVSRKSFYYVVRDFDGPRADIRRAVRGPFDQEEFVIEMREHGVPAPNLVVPR